MSLDAQRLVELMKQVARMVGDESAPFSFCLGKVLTPATDGTKVDGLRVQVSQKLILGDKQLILTNAVRDYEVKLTTKGDDKTAVICTPENDAHYTGTAMLTTGTPSPPDFANHNHAYAGDKWFKVNLKLKAGESVLLLRIDGGQKYIVLDRVFPPNNKGLIQ